MYGRTRDFFRQSDDVTRIIALIAFVILIIVALPGLALRVPGLAGGAQCTSVISPAGNGNNQSVLAAGLGTDALKLELTTDRDTYFSTDPITLNVRFINTSNAPITLALNPDEAVFRYNTTESGLLFFVQQAGSGAVIGEPANVKAPAPVRQQFSADALHLIPPQSRCNQAIVIAPNRWLAAGMAPGQYQIIAVYRNLFRGVLNAPGRLTPTAVFANQGVYITTAEGVRSENVIITVSR